MSSPSAFPSSSPRLPGLDASNHLPGRLVGCSWQAGWRSLLLREYLEPANSGTFTTPACPDQLIVLVVEGPCDIRMRKGAGWEAARYGVGSLGMTRPGEEATLEFRGATVGRTLQLHLPAGTLQRTARALSLPDPEAGELPNALSSHDELVRQTMLALAAAMKEGAPDLYAQTCAEMLAAHLLVRPGSRLPAPTRGGEHARARRVDAFLRANLESELSLDELARQADVSPYHLIRLFKAAFGETPYRRLTRLRMEDAATRLLRDDEPIIEIALSYGYQNPAHFAAAFRRVVGVAPSAWRHTVN